MKRQLIPFENIITDDTLCIFTDASCTKVQENTTVCPGYIVTYGKNEIENPSGYNILTYSTNNRGELYAILMGISVAITISKYYNPSKIILFSDSRISVMGIRDWIYGWFKNIYNGQLYNNQGILVKNQDIIFNIVNLIQKGNTKMHILHTRGHQKVADAPSVEYVNTFREVNKVPYNIELDPDFYKFVIYYNDKIDNLTRDALYYHLNKDPNGILNTVMDTPIKYEFNGFDRKLYKSLITV